MHPICDNYGKRRVKCLTNRLQIIRIKTRDNKPLVCWLIGVLIVAVPHAIFSGDGGNVYVDYTHVIWV